MSSTTLYRASGLALILGASLSIIGTILNTTVFPGDDPHQYLSGFWLFVQGLLVLGEVLLLLGLSGICAYQAPRAGWLGFTGFILTFLGGFLFTNFNVTNLLVAPWLAQVAPHLVASENGPQAVGLFLLTASIVYGIGGLLLGIATMRAGMLPRTAGLLLIAGVILNLVNFPLSGIISSIVGLVAFVLFSLALGWMGYALVSGRNEPEIQPVPVSS